MGGLIPACTSTSFKHDNLKLQSSTLSYLLHYTKQVITTSDSYIRTGGHIVWATFCLPFRFFFKVFKHMLRYQVLALRLLVGGFIKNMNISFGKIFSLITYSFQSFFFFSVPLCSEIKISIWAQNYSCLKVILNWAIDSP